MRVSLRDAAPTIASRCGVPDGRLTASAADLRRYHGWPADPGSPRPLSRRQIALLLVAAFVGPNGDRVVAYADAETPSGQSLVDALAVAIRDPATLERLQLDMDEPAALPTTSSGDARYFGLPGPGTRFAVLDGDTFRDLIEALDSIPPRRAGRPTTKATRWN